MTRQFRHIEVTKPDALALRELVRPFDNSLPDFAKPILTKLAVKVYAALIELEKDIESINIAASEDECLLINQKVGNEDWEGALPLLRQTWAVLFELEYDMPPGTGFALEELLKEISKPNEDHRSTATAS
jgi:hypothetical protein